MIYKEINPEAFDMLFFIEQLDCKITEKQESIAIQRQSMAEKDKLISQKNEAILQKNQEIKKLKESLSL